MGFRKARTKATTTAVSVPSIHSNRFIIACGCLVLVTGLSILQEHQTIAPVKQAIWESTNKNTNTNTFGFATSEESLIDLDSAIQEAALQVNVNVNESLTELNDANAKIAGLQHQLEQLKQESESAHKQLDQLKEDSVSQLTIASTSTSISTSISTSNLASVVFDPRNVCSVFPSPGAASATRLWKEYLPAIFEASKNPAMTKEEVAKLQEILEETLSPARMRRAVRHLPTFGQPILKHVMGIIQKRLADPDHNPPLRIAVFGGSVTSGRGCPGLQCRWSDRFEILVNQFFGGRQIIRVVNLSVGGTSTKTATNRIKYWMYGSSKELQQNGPDVIINSYSTNESLPPWDKKWPEDDLITIVREKVHSSMQEFIREALQSKPCQIPPLVVHVDDYLGPQQPSLMGELAYVSEMTQLSKVCAQTLSHETKRNGMK